MLDGLEAADRDTELLPVAHVLDRDLEHAGRDSDQLRRGGERGTLDGQAAELGVTREGSPSPDSSAAAGAVDGRHGVEAWALGIWSSTSESCPPATPTRSAQAARTVQRRHRPAAWWRRGPRRAAMTFRPGVPPPPVSGATKAVVSTTCERYSRAPRLLENRHQVELGKAEAAVLLGHQQAEHPGAGERPPQLRHRLVVPAGPGRPDDGGRAGALEQLAESGGERS